MQRRAELRCAGRPRTKCSYLTRSLLPLLRRPPPQTARAYHAQFHLARRRWITTILSPWMGRCPPLSLPLLTRPRLWAPQSLPLSLSVPSPLLRKKETGRQRRSCQLQRPHAQRPPPPRARAFRFCPRSLSCRTTLPTRNSRTTREITHPTTGSRSSPCLKRRCAPPRPVAPSPSARLKRPHPRRFRGMQQRATGSERPHLPRGLPRTRTRPSPRPARPPRTVARVRIASSPRSR